MKMKKLLILAVVLSALVSVWQVGPASGWEPPSVTVEGDALKVRVPGAETDIWTLP